MYQVYFYETENGKMPVAEFLDSMDKKRRAKIVSDIQLLQEYGRTLGVKKTKHIKNGIFELRSKFPGGISRILYFFIKDNKIIMTNGFLKKTNKTPKGEIVRAINYKADYERRANNEKV